MPDPRAVRGHHRRFAGDPGQLRREAATSGNNLSREIGVLPVADDNEETARLADLLEGVAGEFSPLEALHGFSIDGVDLETSTLPEGWRARLVRVQNANTAAPGGEPVFTGWCLDKHDLCVAKLCTFREKDRDFVTALLDAGLVDKPVIAERLGQLPAEHLRAAMQASSWLQS